MAPVDVPPFNVVGVMLVEKMPFAVPVRQPVGIVAPAARRREMELRTPRLGGDRHQPHKT